MIHPLRQLGQSTFIRFFLCLLSVVFLAACESELEKVSLNFVLPDGERTDQVQAEVAFTKGQRARGLMFRKTLAPGQGMLFIFPESKELSFWMKNTYVRLDIIFVDRNFRVVSVAADRAPLSEERSRSGSPAKYVVEVPGGWAKKNGLVPGSQLHVDAKLPNPI